MEETVQVGLQLPLGAALAAAAVLVAIVAFVGWKLLSGCCGAARDAVPDASEADEQPRANDDVDH